ncbi:MAG TPA: MMPL family transporter, partial [Flavobacteriaceae bacterium]
MIKILVKYKFLFLLLVIIITGFGLFNLNSIVVKTNFFQFLPDNDPEYDFYKQIKLEIKDDESLLIIGVRNEESIFNKSFIKRVQNFTDSLSQITEFKDVKGITNLSFPMNSLFGLIDVPYLEIKDGVDIKSYQNKIAKDFEITQNFVNPEGTILFVWIEIESGLDNLQVESVLNKIDEIRGEFPELETYLWGKKYMEFSLSKIMANEVKDFVIWILFFLLIALSVIFRNPKAIICSLLLVFISIIIFSGGMAYLKRPFGMMSNLFPTIILIVGISDMIHLSIKYNVERSKGKMNNEAVYNTINEIGWAIFIT